MYDLLEEEYDSEKTKERNVIRRKLKECFKSVTVVGFPYLSLPKEDKYLRYANIKGDGSVRFRQTLTKIVTLILNERNHAKVLAGIAVTPVEMKSLYELDFEKINTEGEILDNDLTDTLFTVNIKRKLTEYMFKLDRDLFEIVKSKKNKALVNAVQVLMENSKKLLGVLIEESQNESRRKKTVMKEWNEIETHIKNSIENTVFFSFNAKLSDSHSLLNKLLPICSYLTACDHHCLEKDFSDRICKNSRFMWDITNGDFKESLFCRRNI